MKKNPAFSTAKTVTLAFVFLTLVVVLVCCNSSLTSQKSNNTLTNNASGKGLKDYYKDYFPFGVAVNLRALKGGDSALIANEFNSITAENAMKMGPIHPEENRYYFNDADAIVNFGLKHNMRIRGHNLLWHRQAPTWFFTDKNGQQVSKEVLLQRLKEHITTVVKRYKGKIYAWDVVNEAIDDDSVKFLRNTPFYSIGGDDIIAKAFQYAHEADPDAILFYNDYATERPSKRDRIYKLLKQLTDAKVPVHGMGIQGHWNLTHPTEKELKDAIEKYASLGLKVQVTELDISIYPSGRSGTENADSIRLKTPWQEKQADQYKKVFKIFRDYKNVISGVTFWNVSDHYSWLDNEPVRGRKNYPLLFDENLQPKKAYGEVVDF